jgi:hypothetical protein
MLSEPPRCRPVPVLALKGADSPRGLHRGHSPGHGSPPGARSTGGGWSLPASWPDPNSLRQLNPDHDERYRGAAATCRDCARSGAAQPRALGRRAGRELGSPSSRLDPRSLTSLGPGARPHGAVQLASTRSRPAPCGPGRDPRPTGLPGCVRAECGPYISAHLTASIAPPAAALARTGSKHVRLTRA